MGGFIAIDVIVKLGRAPLRAATRPSSQLDMNLIARR